jgi:hypothetical protein
VGSGNGGGGDVDGDGVADFVMCVYGTRSSQAYVLYGVANAGGAATTWPTDSTLRSIAQDSNKGRIIDGMVSNTELGMFIAIVGDVNKDGYDDIAISTISQDASNQGKAWLVWGKKRTSATNPLSINTLDASKFVQITGDVL